MDKYISILKYIERLKTGSVMKVHNKEGSLTTVQFELFLYRCNAVIITLVTFQ